MAPKPHKLGFIFAAVLVMAVFVAITTWAAVPKHESAAAIAGMGTIYRPDLWRCTSASHMTWGNRASARHDVANTLAIAGVAKNEIAT